MRGGSVTGKSTSPSDRPSRPLSARTSRRGPTVARGGRARRPHDPSAGARPNRPRRPRSPRARLTDPASEILVGPRPAVPPRQRSCRARSLGREPGQAERDDRGRQQRLDDGDRICRVWLDLGRPVSRREGGCPDAVLPRISREPTRPTSAMTCQVGVIDGAVIQARRAGAGSSTTTSVCPGRRSA